MLKNQPAVVQMKALVKEAQGNTADRDGLAQLERREAYLNQVIHDSTQSLARFFLEIDSNYKQFKIASRQRAAAALRLESQRAYHDEGRITIDRFLDAISQYASASATEAQYGTTYNNAIVALEEAKGTLLDHDQITVVEAPNSAVSIAVVPGFAVKGEWHEPPFLPERTATNAHQSPTPSASPPTSRTTTSEPDVKASRSQADNIGKTYSFQFTVGIGSRPIEFRGSFTITPAQSGQRPKASGEN